MVDRLAADVFQDVFRQLLQGGELKRLRERSGLSAYLTIIATRTALDAMRADIRRQRRYGGVDTGTVEAASTDGLDASSDLLSREREQVLRSMLEDLPYRERTCLELAYVHERTHREIALILGVPQDTVSTVLRRTRERLADLLRKKGIEG
ncbi:MAG: hypothetical protein MOGMAGMI_01081 [Candidatus Omnitrophica bacterium]|nr:hypothetical protein [Candidatus Omnitrophota bacterium]